MSIFFNFELELVKERIYNDYIEPIEEYTFVVPQNWFIDIYERDIVPMFDYQDVDINEFLDVYDPDIEGQFIYTLAKQAGVVIDEGWCALVDDNYDY